MQLTSKIMATMHMINNEESTEQTKFSNQLINELNQAIKHQEEMLKQTKVILELIQVINNLQDDNQQLHIQLKQIHDICQLQLKQDKCSTKKRSNGDKELEPPKKKRRAT